MYKIVMRNNICYELIFALFVKIIYVISIKSVDRYYNMTPNRKLSNYSFVEHSVTRPRCIIKCLEHATCKYASYLPLTGECQLSEHVPGDGVITLDIADGWESFSG